MRAAPGALLEPWAGAVVNSLETARAMIDEVPGLRLLVDTGHVADWGGDPLEMLELADHVQLRQGEAGLDAGPRRRPDAASSTSPPSLHRLDALDYRGCLSVEYFDLPEHGWPLDDPVRQAVDLAAKLRPLLT